MFIVGVVLFFFSLVMMFKQLDTQQSQDIIERNSNVDFQRLNLKLSVIENEIVENQGAVDKVKFISLITPNNPHFRFHHRIEKHK